MPSDSHSLRIIVVDDHQVTADALVQFLKNSGYDAVAATGGQQALALAEERQPECVLLDVRMPGIDGVQLGSILRQRYGGDITMIAMTGVEESSKQYEMMLALCDYLLRKPIDLDKLSKLLPPAGQ